MPRKPWTLSWTTGTNYGSGNNISYTLELAKAGTDFADSYVAVENAVRERTQWTKSVEELNHILRNAVRIGYAGKAFRWKHA